MTPNMHKYVNKDIFYFVKNRTNPWNKKMHKNTHKKMKNEIENTCIKYGRTMQFVGAAQAFREL